jgi:hypothetical protein
MEDTDHDKLMSNFFAQTGIAAWQANLLLWFKLNFKARNLKEEAKFLLPFKVLRVTNQRIPY